MSNYISKSNVSVAQQQHRNKFDLSHSHITTMDFYTPRPVSIIECEPNSTINVAAITTVRMSPMVEPMYGDIKVVNRAFFVPMRTVMANFNDFITNSPSVKSNNTTGIIQKVPQIQRASWRTLFTDPNLNLSIRSTPADFAIKDSEKVATYQFTNKGKQYYNIICSLGYKPDLFEWTPGYDSALPLLAYARIYFDWIRNTAYDNFASIEKYFKLNDSQYDELHSAEINELLEMCYRVCYQSDYFTAAYDHPLGPNSNTISGQVIPDLSTIGTNQHSVIGNTDGASIQQTGSEQNDYLTSISQYAIMALHKMQDWLTRKQVVGSRALDRYMAEFGVQLDSAKMNRCIYLGKQDVPIHISDVMQTSPDATGGTSDAFGVGSYSGKGFASDGSHLCKFTSDEFGYLIIVSFVEPRLSYPYGRDRMLAHQYPLDFFTPEFDNLGNQAIRMDELSAGFMRKSFPDGYVHNGIFGFTPRYAEYKVKHDYLTGDFMLNSKNTSLEGWYLTRNMDPDELESVPRHDHNFTLADPAEFNTIFFDESPENDHFFMRYIFQVEKFSAMKTLYDTYDYEDDSRTIRMSVGGTRVTE